MSRIGKKPVNIPEKVEVIIDGKNVKVKGPKGELAFVVPGGISIVKEKDEILVSTIKTTKQARALWGTTRSVIQNMVIGVNEGYEINLEIEGVGFKAQLNGNNLVLNVGFSHPVEVGAPEGIKFSVEKNRITVSGIDKVLVGETAAKIRSIKKPEPYKGKGIRYEGEYVRRKEGKTAK